MDSSQRKISVPGSRPEPSNVASPPDPEIRHNPYGFLYDVVVIGGGMCGVAAALAAAGQGKEVLLVERRAGLGWELTFAMHARVDEPQHPAAGKMLRRMRAIAGIKDGRSDQPTAELALDLLMQEKAVDVLLFSQPSRVELDGGAIRGVWVASKSGEQVIRGRSYIDATETGLLWGHRNRARSDRSSDNESGSERISGRFPPRMSSGHNPARQSIFFNHVEPGLSVPLELGDAAHLRDITVLPSVREGEACVEFTIPENSSAEGRAAFKWVVPFVRSRVPQLSQATVTHAGFEPYPLEVDAVYGGDWEAEHPRLRNLFPAGIWVFADTNVRTKANTPFGRADIGGYAGDRVAGWLDQCDSQSSSKTDTRDIDSAGDESDRSEVQVEALNPRELEVQVVVAGGGTAGSLAGVAAGTMQASTVVFETLSFLGGTVTGSMQFYSGHGVSGGLQDLYHERVQAYAENMLNGAYPGAKLHPEGCKIVLDELLEENNVTVIFDSTVISVDMDGDRVRALTAATPKGLVTARAHTFIDSTGDADLAAWAGAPSQIGRDIDGVLHAYTQAGCMVRHDRDGGIGGANFDSGYVDPWDTVDMTRARRAGIRQLYERFARNLCGETPLLYNCPMIGLRQARVISGDYRQSLYEQIMGGHYEDCIGFAAAKYDCHSQDFANQDDLSIFWIWILGNRERWIGGEIPFRSMLPKGVEGLLVACRSASTEYEGNYQFRVVGNMKRIGEAAGYAAALCCRLDTTPRRLDVGLVQEQLRKSGALAEAVRPEAVIRKRSPNDLQQMLLKSDGSELADAVWLLAHGGDEEREILRSCVSEGPPERRFWAAVALAWQKDEAATAELSRAVEERMSYRSDFTPMSRNMRPLWQCCIVLLGRTGSAEAIPVIVETLEDRSIDMDVMIACIRSLGRIGDRSAVPALTALLERNDLPRQRKFQQTNPIARFPVQEDALWQVELAIAEVLADFGERRPEIVAKHLADRRNHVRRYAYRIAGRIDMKISSEHSLAEHIGEETNGKTCVREYATS